MKEFSSIAKLIDSFQRLPGIGHKTAEKMAYQVLEMKDENVDRPQAMKIRQDIQEAMTFSLPNKKFCEEEIELVEIDIGLDKLGWNFQNFRILNLTDIHLGQWINPEYLDELVDYVNTLNVDLITLIQCFIEMC